MTTRGLTMTTPTSQQDELRTILIKHRTRPGQLLNDLDSYIDRTVAERVLAIIGEDDDISDHPKEWTIDMIEKYPHEASDLAYYNGRNKLRAELRAAVQTQGEQKDE